MSWLKDDKVTFVWTSVPSGAVRDGGSLYLKLDVIVSPRMSVEQSQAGGAGNKLFADWPAMLQANSPAIDSFDVIFRNNVASTTILKNDGDAVRLDLRNVVKAGVWPVLFPSTEFSPTNAEAPKRLPVDRRAQTYDSCSITEKLRMFRGYDALNLACHSLLAGNQATAGHRAWLANQAMMQQETLSALAWSKSDERDKWSRIPLQEFVFEMADDELNQQTAIVDKVRRDKLFRRNKFRLSSDPTKYLRDEVVSRLEKLTRLGGAMLSRRQVFDPDPDDFLDVAMFHGRARQLPSNDSSLPNRNCDFAETLAHVRGFPELAHRLGLILKLWIKLTDDEAAKLAAPQWRVWVRPRWRADLQAGVADIIPSTWCTFKQTHLTNQTYLMFAAGEVTPDGRSEDPHHHNGYLKLPAAEWQLNTMEIDGGALKTINMAHSVASRMAPTFVTSLNGKILSANWSTNSLLADRRVVDKSLFDYVRTEDVPALREAMEKLASTGLPRRSSKHIVNFVHEGSDGRPASGEFIMTLKTNESRSSMRLEWKMALATGDDGSSDQPLGPSHRTVGLGLIRRDAGGDMATSATRQDSLVNSPSSDGEVTLAAADLILGYIPEIWAPPAANANGTPQWHSTTRRYEKYPGLGDQWLAAEGYVALGLTNNSDAAPADQHDPSVQGNVSPSLFVYANDSLGVTSDRKSSQLHESEKYQGNESAVCANQPLVETQAMPGTLPLVRYSHITSSPFEYAVRCRYIDVAGNSRELDRHTLGSRALYQKKLIQREEPIAPPRVLTYGALNQKLRPGSTLKLLVAKAGQVDSRCLIPPKTSAEMALRYGYALGSELVRYGGMSSIDLDPYAEVPTEWTIPFSGSPSKTVTTPVARRIRRPQLPGYYYLPDPASIGVTIAVSTFYSAAHELQPLFASLMFYRQGLRWPKARSIGVLLYCLPEGEITAKVELRGQNFYVGLPLGWTGSITVSSLSSSSELPFARAEHFTSWSDLQLANALEMQYADLASNTGSPNGPLEVSNRFPRHPWRLKRLLALGSGADSSLYFAGQFQLTHWLGALIASPAYAQKYVSGLNTVVSPTEHLTIVCPTQKPLFAPSLEIASVPRKVDEDSVSLNLSSLIDDKSTSEVTVSARWKRLNDDPLLDKPQVVRDIVDVSTLKMQEPVVYVPTNTQWQARLDLETAGYRRVRYLLSAQTRFSDFYPGKSKADLSRDGRDQPVKIYPNVSRPKRVAPKFLVPTLTWTTGVTPLANRPFQRFDCHSQYGIRVFLERGWNLRELLGVVTLPSLGEFQADELNRRVITDVKAEKDVPSYLESSISQWGADPTTASNLPNTVPRPSDFFGYRRVGGDLLLPPLNDDLPSDPQRRVSVIGFNPKWDDRRKLWYCDIGLRQIPSSGCFIRLALARFQPNSIRDYELSAPVRADFIQLRSDRIVNIMREPTDVTDNTIRVTIFEPRIEGRTPLVGHAPPGTLANRFELHIEEQCVTADGTAIGWFPVLSTDIQTREEPSIIPGVLWNGSFHWTRRTGVRRLVIRELEVFSNKSEREIYSNVLEL
jgi:hypothetical protein